MNFKNVSEPIWKFATHTERDRWTDRHIDTQNTSNWQMSTSNRNGHLDQSNEAENTKTTTTQHSRNKN